MSLTFLCLAFRALKVWAITLGWPLLDIQKTGKQFECARNSTQTAGPIPWSDSPGNSDESGGHQTPSSHPILKMKLRPPMEIKAALGHKGPRGRDPLVAPSRATPAVRPGCLAPHGPHAATPCWLQT